MSKVDIKTLDSLSHNDASATKLINDNFDALKKAVEDSVSRTGKTPNFMAAEFDMNSRRIINLGEPVDDTDAVSYGAYKEHIHNAVQAAEDIANSAKKAAASAAESKQYSIESRRARDLSEQYANEAKKTVENVTADITQAVSDGLTDITNAVYNGKTTLEETTAAGEEALKKYNINTFFNPFVASMTYTIDGWLPATVYAAEGYNFVKTLTYNSGYPMPSSSPYSASAFVTLSMKDAVSGNVGPYATAFLTNSDKNEAVFGLSLYVKELPTEPIVAENISWFIKERPNGTV